MTYWADEALDGAGLVLAGRCPGEAPTALSASRPVADDDGRLGPRSWEDAAHAARATPVDRAIVRAVPELEAV